MTLTIDISQEEEVRLREEAALRGKTPDDLLRTALGSLIGTDVENRPSWSAAQGMFPYPMAGEHAKAWVTRTRREGDERRERLLNRQTSPMPSPDES